jgi:glycosyltransferase involved in cell wall biosynthesis
LDYAIVTPARDEQALLQQLAKTIFGQTVRPTLWVIADNGSRDGTRKIAEQLSANHRWIHLISVEGAEQPTRGGPVVEAFESGLRDLREWPNVLVKLDCDVVLPHEYFERLMNEFANDPALGIASGTQLQPYGREWRPRRMTGTMVPAPARAYRRECLVGLLPLERCVGWDHVDQLKAVARGWRTAEIGDLYFLHVRPEGARDGGRYWHLQGAAAHYLGYRPTYLLFRTLYRARSDPRALQMISGFTSAYLRQTPRCTDRWVVAKGREQQRLLNLPHRIRELRRGRSAEA